MAGSNSTKVPLMKLRNITYKIGSGATPRGGKKSYKKQGITLIRSQNVYDFRFQLEGLAFIDENQANVLSNVEVKPNDILLNITGASVARCCMVPTNLLPARVNQHVAIVRIDLNCANPYFVLYSINSPKYKHHLLTLAQGGATREALTKDTIGDFEIPFPPLLTQHKIASILSAYDNLIENNTRRIQILEEMAQSLYREWFVEFRFPGHEKVKMVESELGMVPEGWEVKNVFDLADVSYGMPLKSKSFSIEKEGTPVIRIRDIPNGETKTFTTEEADEKYVVENGDILVGMDGDFHMSIWSGGRAYQNQRVARFKSKGLIGNYYLFLSLIGPIRFFDLTIVGTTVAHLGDKHIKTIKIILPSDKILELAIEEIEPLAIMQLNLKLKNRNLRRTRDLLLPKLISGEMDVSSLAIPTGELT